VTNAMANKDSLKKINRRIVPCLEVAHVVPLMQMSRTSGVTVQRDFQHSLFTSKV
jgi:hypothetical protein